MLDIREAQRLVLDHVPPARSLEVIITEAWDHWLAEDVLADRDIPPFNKSVMDGFALHAEDATNAPITLEVVGETRAGAVPDFRIGHGQAARIMTGAIVPEGADAVQIVEKTESLDAGRRIRILEPVKNGAHIAPVGNEVKRDARVLETGRYIGPAEMAVLATFGRHTIKIWQKPGAAVLTTGDELVPVHETPAEAQIRDSNAYALLAQLKMLGVRADYLGIARDDKNDLRKKIAQGLKYDVLVLTGGVSMGKYDLVEDIFAEFGVQVYFEKVAIKPGKPAVFGRKDGTVVFGLPGNPVSSYVTFEYFVRPAILKWMGAGETGLLTIKAELKNAVRQKPGRTSFLPAWLEYQDDKWFVEVLPWKGSADIVAFSRANAMFIFPKELDTYPAGATVEVLFLDDFFKRAKRL
jgi:molybdopterin molybdotransferase